MSTVLLQTLCWPCIKTFFSRKVRNVLSGTGGAPWLVCRNWYVRQLYSHDLSFDLMPWADFLFDEILIEVEPDCIAYLLHSFWRTYKHMHSLKDKPLVHWPKVQLKYPFEFSQFACLSVLFFTLSSLGQDCFHWFCGPVSIKAAFIICK